MGKTDKKPSKQEKEPKKQEVEQEQKPAETSKAEKFEEACQVEKPEDILQAKLDATQEELKKQKDILLRTAAEYDNYRKRTDREKAGVYADATASAVVEFLSVSDNLARALEQKDCSAEDLRKGVEMVNTQLTNALTKLGVKEMGKVGDPFNPDLHNAVSHVENEDAGENTIAQVFEKGYQLGDKIVRHAMVQVAN